MEKEKMIIKRININALENFLKENLPDAVITVFDDGIEISYNDYTWTM